MAAYDQALMLEDNAALTSSRVSTNTIPLGNLSAGNAERDLGGNENQLYLNIKVKEAFTSTGASTLVGAFQTDETDAFGSAATVFSTPTIAKASLTLGARFSYPLPPGAYEDYCRASWTVAVANFDTGKFDVWIGPQQGRFVSADSGAVVV